MKFCSVGAVRVNSSRNISRAGRVYVFDGDVEKPSDLDSYFQIIPKARALSLSNGSEISLSPVAGIRNGKKYLMAFSCSKFSGTYSSSYDYNGLNSGRWATGVTFTSSVLSRQQLLNMIGIYTGTTASFGLNSTSAPAFRLMDSNKHGGKGTSSNPLDYSNALMIVASDLENKPVKFDVTSARSFTFERDLGVSNNGRWYYDNWYQNLSGMTYSLTTGAGSQLNSRAAPEFGVGATSISLGSLANNSINIIQEYYVRFNGSNGLIRYSNAYVGFTLSGSTNNFSNQSSPYIDTDKPDEIINLSFAACVHEEADSFVLTVSDFGTDIIVAGSVLPNTQPIIEQKSIYTPYTATISC